MPARTPSKSLSPVARNIHRDFINRGYAVAYEAGIMGDAIVADLIRSIAFTHLTSQDESINLRAVMTKIEPAVDEVIAFILRTQRST